MAKITIGGIEYTIPELSFAGLELAWPYLEKAMNTDILMDPLGGPSAGIGIIAAGLMESEGFDPADFGMPDTTGMSENSVLDGVMIFLKKRLKAKEISAIHGCVSDITKEAGLDDESGEGLAALQELLIRSRQNPSTETALDILSSLSLPELKEGVGIE